MKNRFYACFILFTMLLCGCQKEAVNIPHDILDLGGRLAANDVLLSTNHIHKTVDQMQSNDVIVAINGYPLTKKLFDRMMGLRLRTYMKRGANIQTAGSLVDEYRKTYPKVFMGHRLLVDKALELKIVSPKEVDDYICDAVRNSAKRAKKSVRAYLSAFEGDQDLFFYELAVNYAVNKIVNKEIPPLLVVTPDFVSNVQETVVSENAAKRATNALYRAKLSSLRERIIKGQITFEKASDDFSHIMDDDSQIGEGGEWGTFSQGDFENSETERVVFSMRKGDLSEVIEEENGFQLIRVDEIMPAEKDENGNVLTAERRTLSHIYRSKEPMLMTQDDVGLSKDLQRQMQIRAINRYTTNLATNGLNKIVYPNGRILFVK